jgi:hypothetical protein
MASTTLKMLYSFASPQKRGKERFETILEPMQAIIQIGCISFYPVGTKLAIKYNMLVIQPPNYSQPVSRWYYNDTQDDLCYLFNVFSRFKKFYSFMEAGPSDVSALYAMLVVNARAGIDKLIRTYSDTNKPHILHTLSMYKTMLGSNADQPQLQLPQQSQETLYSEQSRSQSQSQSQSQQVASQNSSVSVFGKRKGSISSSAPATESQTPLIPMNAMESQQQSQQQPQQQQQPQPHSLTSDPAIANASIDSIFSTIVDKYNPQIFSIIHNVLLQLHKKDDGTGNGDNYLHYIGGLNQILHPINVSIKKWIDENIVF